MRALATNTMQLTWIATGDGLVDEDVHVWCNYTGQKEGASQGWGWIEALHVDDRECARHLWQQAVATGHCYENHQRILAQDGSYHLLRAKYIPLFNDDGALREWLSWFTETETEAVPLDQKTAEHPPLLHLIFEQAPTGMVCTSFDGYFIHMNEQFCRIVGYSQEELATMNLRDIYHQDSRSFGYSIFRQMLLNNVQYHITEEQGICKNGAQFWAKVTVSILRLPSGEPLHFLSLVEDTTRRKQEEQESLRLLECEQAARKAKQQARQEVIELDSLLKVVFETIVDGVIIFNREGKILQINAAARQLLELPSDRVETYDQLIDLYTARDEQNQLLTIEQRPIGRILDGDILSSAQTRDISVRVPSGREIFLSTTGAPLYDQQGKLAGGVAVFRDVTEHNKKERHILQALNSLLTLVEAIVQVPEHITELVDEKVLASSSLDAIGERLANLAAQVLNCRYVFITTLDPTSGRLRLVGEAGLISTNKQLTYEKINTSTLADYFDDETIAQLCANEVVQRDLTQQPFTKSPIAEPPRILTAPMLLGKELRGVFTIGKLGSDSTYTPEEVALVRAFAKLIAMVIERMRLLKEWTETRAKELTLEEANRHFDAFLSIASHELKTPLTTIKGNIQLVLRRLEVLKRQEAEPTQALLNSLQRIRQPLEYAIQRAGVQDRMISELLDTSRIRANKLVYMMRHCDLATIVRNVVEDIQQAAPDRTITLHLPVLEAIPVMADADRIGQVVNNYLSNAIKYSLPDQAVDVYVQLEDSRVLVSVQDQGQGLLPEDQEYVWERFYRADVNVQYSFGAGLGLGLYICRTIVEHHHGQVGLHSVQGEGSTFWFTLPLTTSHEDEHALNKNH